MKTQTLYNIKKELGKFLLLVEDVAQQWEEGQPHLTTIRVLLQNMVANSEGTVGYNEQAEVLEIYRIERTLKHFADYYKSHFENWVAEEVSMIIYANIMDEDEIELQQKLETESNL